jgi:hypothetical protein
MNAIGKLGFVKVYEQSEGYVQEFHLAQQLCLVDR